jgi:hypothetical protein
LTSTSFTARDYGSSTGFNTDYANYLASLAISILLSLSSYVSSSSASFFVWILEISGGGLSWSFLTDIGV